jgi:hypothetical protein
MDASISLRSRDTDLCTCDCSRNAHDSYFGACMACKCPRFIPHPQPPTDNVNHPKHYTSNGIEVIDIIEAFKLDFHLGNVAKYVLRSGKKTDELEDLKKARWYLNRKIERLEK